MQGGMEMDFSINSFNLHHKADRSLAFLNKDKAEGLMYLYICILL